MNTRTLTATLVATAIIVGVALVAPRASVAQMVGAPPIDFTPVTAAAGGAIASSVNEAIHESAQAAAEIAREQAAAHDDSEQPTDDQPADS